jgi:hypothetical protein
MHHPKGVLIVAAIAIAGATAGPAAAVNTSGPAHHSNCTAGVAAGSAIVDGDPGAVGSVAMPPKQFGSSSDVGFYSRTNRG